MITRGQKIRRFITGDQKVRRFLLIGMITGDQEVYHRRSEGQEVLVNRDDHRSVA